MCSRLFHPNTQYVGKKYGIGLQAIQLIFQFPDYLQAMGNEDKEKEEKQDFEFLLKTTWPLLNYFYLKTNKLQCMNTLMNLWECKKIVCRFIHI
jgi:hypothetical protein